MALTVSFGNGGNSKATNLTEANQLSGGQALNGQTVTTTEGPNGTNLPAGTASAGVAQVSGPGSLSGTGGSVAYEHNADGAWDFDVVGKWNSVKNAQASLTGDAHGEDVTFTDFVHVDINFGNATTASEINIFDVKRANVTTGVGNDTVNITLATNSQGWENVANVNAGDGNDTIKISAGSVSDSAKITDGHFTTAMIDGGAGNDTIDLSGVNLLAATVTGGTGNNTVTLGAGAEKVVYTDGEFLTVNGYGAGDSLDLGGKVAGVDYDIHIARNGDTVYEFDNGKITFHNGSPIIAA
ncbi:rhizobiocin [Aureimonas leprariae]|nr:rhizobiocin [Aureimonas leprariae]